MTLEQQQRFVNACNTLNGVEFISGSLEYLNDIRTKQELNDFVNTFGKISKLKTIENSTKLVELCVLLRDKIYEILIANGEVPEIEYIYLYNYYSVCELPQDPRYTAYIDFIDTNVSNPDMSDMEKMYLVVLRFFAAMANSRGDALDKFLTVAIRLNTTQVGSVEFSRLVSDFLDDSKVGFGEVLGIVSKSWEKEYYFCLPKVERRSIFNWSLHSIWLVQKYFNHPLWNSAYPLWKEIFFEHIKRNECDEAMYVQFFIFHAMGNSFQTQEDWANFNDEVIKPASEYYSAWCNNVNLPKCKASASEGKKAIGFLWDRFVMSSPFKVAYSLWKALMQSSEFTDKYEIKIYCMSYFEKSINEGSCIDMVESLGIEVFDGAVPFYNDGFYHNHLEKALHIRNQIIADGVDTLIVWGGGYDINDFIVSSRAAPKQIFWSHGNGMYDVDGLDKRITHCAINSKYKFENFTVPMDVERFYNPPVAKERIEKERAKYPKDAFILGVIGRLIKVDSDEYLQTIAEIMHKNPNTIFIAAGTGNDDTIRAKVEKLGISERFYMPGFVDPHVYGHIIDLWCDTFPLGGGESVEEFRAKSGVCITKTVDENYIENANVVAANDVLLKSFLETYNYCDDTTYVDGELIGVARYAYTREEYVYKADKFINNTLFLDKYRLLAKQQTEFFGDLAHKKAVETAMDLLS